MPSNYELALRDTANYACDKSAEYAGQCLQSLKGGRLAFYPNVKPKECKFSVGVVDEYHYLVYQELGFQTFAMKELRDKTIPLKLDGQIVFRKATGINEFRSGSKTYWRRNVSGEIIPSREQKRAWVHPGMPPKHFIRDGVATAATERADDLFRAIMEDAKERGYDDLIR